jgi:hypothetical protein
MLRLGDTPETHPHFKRLRKYLSRRALSSSTKTAVGPGYDCASARGQKNLDSLKRICLREPDFQTGLRNKAILNPALGLHQKELASGLLRRALSFVYFNLSIVRRTLRKKSKTDRRSALASLVWSPFTRAF